MKTQNMDQTQTIITKSGKILDPQQMHVCRLCDKLLSSSSSLDRHMLTHSGERPFVCKRCHMTFTTNGNMHRHMRTHLHKDSLARQQQEQIQLKQSLLVGGGAAGAGHLHQMGATSHSQLAPAAGATPLEPAGFYPVPASQQHHHQQHHHLAQQLAQQQQQQQQQQPILAGPLASLIGGGAPQPNHQNPVTALLNQQLIAAAFQQQQQSPVAGQRSAKHSGMMNASSNNNNNNNQEVSTTFHHHQPQPDISTSAAQLLQKHHQTLVASQMMQAQQAPLEHHLDPKALMSAALAAASRQHGAGQGQANSLESVKTVMLAAAAAAAAVANQKSQRECAELASPHHSDLLMELPGHDGAGRVRGKRRKQVNPLRSAHRPDDSASASEGEAQGGRRSSSLASPSGDDAHSRLAAHRKPARRHVDEADDDDELEIAWAIERANPRLAAKMERNAANEEDFNNNNQQSATSTTGAGDEAAPAERESASKRRAPGRELDSDDADSDADGREFAPDDAGARSIQQRRLQERQREQQVKEAPSPARDDDQPLSDDEGPLEILDAPPVAGLVGAPKAERAASENERDNELQDGSDATTTAGRCESKESARGAANWSSARQQPGGAADGTMEGENSNSGQTTRAARRSGQADIGFGELNEHEPDANLNANTRDTFEDQDQTSSDSSHTSRGHESSSSNGRRISGNTTMGQLGSFVSSSTSQAGNQSNEHEINLDLDDDDDNDECSRTNLAGRNNSPLFGDKAASRTTASLIAPDYALHRVDRFSGLNNNLLDEDRVKQHYNQNSNTNTPMTTQLNDLEGELDEGEEEDDEIVEDISQSYVKTANPNATRKGGKRNRHCYKCKLCTYSSVDRCTLVRHLRIHSGERPYICGICRYAFTTKANCERHVRKRHKKQYNSLGGSGGVKGSNGGGRSLIITDHSNHQTIPVKVNPVAAQTISQTLQRIQEKEQQQQEQQPSSMDGAIRVDGQHRMREDDNIERITAGATSMMNSSPSSLSGKRKHRYTDMEAVNDEDLPAHHRRRLANKLHKSAASDKPRTLSGTFNLFAPQDTNPLGGANSAGKQASDFLLDQAAMQAAANKFMGAAAAAAIGAPQAGDDSDLTNANQTSELFVNLLAQIQQMTNSNQQDPANSSALPMQPGSYPMRRSNAAISPSATTVPMFGEPAATSIPDATFLANILAAGKAAASDSTMAAQQQPHQQPALTEQLNSLLSSKHLSQQLRNLNLQNPFFGRRNPFDPFSSLDFAQALDLSCKLQTHK